MQASSGLAASKCLASPPTMKVRVPASAPPVPPETGASSIASPLASASNATSRAVSGSMVEQSMRSVPALACARTPDSFS